MHFTKKDNNMAFSPNTTIRLCSVPFDASQKNQLRFASVAAQSAYFAGVTVATYNNLTYQRKDNTLRIPVHVDSLWNCNYVMYDNINFTNKWFYGFITKMQYENDNMTIVTIETDVFQTWFLSCTLKHSFVEREMVPDDTLGVNVSNEGLELGEFVQNGLATAAGLGDMDLILATTLSTEGLPAGGVLINNIYAGCLFYGQHGTSLTAMNTILSDKSTAAAEASVVALYMAPHLFSNFPTGCSLSGEGQFEDLIAVTGPVRPTAIDGYTPKNWKLLSYPFSFLYAHNNNGAAAVFKWEHFDGTPAFEIIGSPLPSSTYKMYPSNLLAGGSEAALEDYDQALTLSGFPACAWNYDAYKSWLATNSMQTAIGVAGGILAIGVGAAVGNGVAVAGGALSVASTLAAVGAKSIQPPQAQGNLNSGGANCAIKINDFFLQAKSIRYDQAEQLDKYFDMYGYKIGKVKVPDINNRPYWNYCQTIDVNITGPVPADDMLKLKRIFNNGCTFWHNAANFCDYSLDNTGG